jgi:hypothetical protein
MKPSLPPPPSFPPFLHPCPVFHKSQAGQPQSAFKAPIASFTGEEPKSTRSTNRPLPFFHNKQHGAHLQVLPGPGMALSQPPGLQECP